MRVWLVGGGGGGDVRVCVWCVCVWCVCVCVCVCVWSVNIRQQAVCEYSSTSLSVIFPVLMHLLWLHCTFDRVDNLQPPSRRHASQEKKR